MGNWTMSKFISEGVMYQNVSGEQDILAALRDLKNDGDKAVSINVHPDLAEQIPSKMEGVLVISDRQVPGGHCFLVTEVMRDEPMQAA